MSVLTQVEIAVCAHREESTRGASGGLTHASCPVCGQCRRYKVGDLLSAVITKIGRIGGAIVMPLAGIPLEGLSPEDTRLIAEGWDVLNEKLEKEEFRKTEAPTLAPSEPRPESKRHRRLGRPQTGEWSKCKDCGTDIYVKKYRMKSNQGKYCKPCYGKANPPPPRAKSAGRLLLDKHQGEVLADYGQMTITALEGKWEMKKGYFYHLKKEWESEGVPIPVAFADRPQEVEKKEVPVEEQTAISEPAAEVTEETSGPSTTASPAAAGPGRPTTAPLKLLRRRDRPAYWEDNKEAMVGDYYSITVREFLLRWRISSVTWSRLREKWELKGKDAVAGRRRGKNITQGKDDTTLPPFPPFNDSWHMLVQLEWLQTYKVLCLEGKQ